MRLPFMSNKIAVKSPSEDWVRKIQKEIEYTPDVTILQQQATQLLFVGDDMKLGHRRHHLLGDGAEFKYEAWTKHAYSFFKKKLGKETFPIPFDEKTELAPFSVIRGELWSVHSNTIIELDRHRQNGLQFLRQEVPVVVHYRTVLWNWKIDKVTHVSRVQDKVIPVWMYLGNPEYWNELLDAGFVFSKVNQKPYREGSSGKYYEFSYSEYFEK